MMRVDDDFVHAKVAQPRNRDLEQRAPIQLNQRLRAVVGERPVPFERMKGRYRENPARPDSFREQLGL
jgi:hypothetical protein